MQDIRRTCLLYEVGLREDCGLHKTEVAVWGSQIGVGNKTTHIVISPPPVATHLPHSICGLAAYNKYPYLLPLRHHSVTCRMEWTLTSPAYYFQQIMKYHFLQVIVNCPLAMLPHICLLSWFVLCGRNTSVLWRNMSTSYCLGMKQFPSWIPHAPWHSYPITLPRPSCRSPLLLKVFMACVFFLPTQRRVPVKWTAPEALESQLFSYKSDM